MNEWEARYKALAAGIKDKTIIDNAEAMVSKAIDLSQCSPLSFSEAFSAMLQAAGLINAQQMKPLGIDWLNVWPDKPKKSEE